MTEKMKTTAPLSSVGADGAHLLAQMGRSRM